MGHMGQLCTGGTGHMDNGAHGAIAYRGYGVQGTWAMGHRVMITGVWATWTMRYRGMGNGVQGYGAHGQWDTGGNGVQEYRAHGQWGIVSNWVQEL